MGHLWFGSTTIFFRRRLAASRASARWSQKPWIYDMYSHTTEIWDRIEDLLDYLFVFDGKPLQILMQISEVDGLLVQNPTPLDNKKLPWDPSSWANLHPVFLTGNSWSNFTALNTSRIREKVSGYGLRIYLEWTTEKDRHLFQTRGDATYQTNSQLLVALW